MGQLRDALGVKPHVRLVIGIDLPAECRGLFFRRGRRAQGQGFSPMRRRKPPGLAGKPAKAWKFRAWKSGLGDFEAECARAGLAGEAARLVWDDRPPPASPRPWSLSPRRRHSCASRRRRSARRSPCSIRQESWKQASRSFPQPIPRPDGRPAQRGVWIVPVNQPQTLARAARRRPARRLGARKPGAPARAHASGFSVERMCSLALAAMRAISNDFRAMSDVPGRFGTPGGNAALKCGVDFAELFPHARNRFAPRGFGRGGFCRSHI